MADHDPVSDVTAEAATEPLGGRERPLFVDNRGGNTLERAIREHLAALREEGRIPWELCIATAFFTLEGFQLLADELEQMHGVRLLLGAEPDPEFARPERSPGDPRLEDLAERHVRRNIERLEHGLARHRDLLPFDAETFAGIERLVAFLQRDGVQVRRYERQFLHAKAFDFRLNEGGLLVGSSNLTGGGLRRSLELNLGHYEDALVGRVEQWYDELWEEAVDFDLADVYARLLADFPPYLVYLRVLLELYGVELADEEREEGLIRLTEFQHHGVWRALKLLERHHGVLIADGVGLGKTYTAGEIMRRYVERRQRVLLVCPAQLRDSTWHQFLSEHQLFVESVSYEELAMEQELGGDYPGRLDRPIDEYALVVVDEAHNYRRPNATKRAGVLRRLLSGQRRDLALLTATPVNNSLWDLYHLLNYFLRQDAALAKYGVLSLRARFKEAMEEDPYELHPDQLFPVIDATTVKRTRRFIRNHYEGDRLPIGPGGSGVAIRFPTPTARKLEYDLDEAMPDFFDQIEEALMPEEGQPRLKLARYMPDEYLEEADGGGTGRALVGLIRSGLLKRFESSAYAFRCTMERMVHEHQTFLDALDRGYIATKRALLEIAGVDDDEAVEELLSESDQVQPAEGYAVEALRADVEADLEVLRDLRADVSEAMERPDPKMGRLVEALKEIAHEAREEAADEEDERDKRKVLIFSFYEDTVDRILDELRDAIDRDPELAVYRGRVAAVGGQDSKGGVSRRTALLGFAPKTTGARDGAEDLFDILISTDVLAEGMNLQQCRHIINYDLPWNPMRLVQRHGRIDRINSRHPKVFLDTFFPDRQLDRLLDLEARVLRKLAQAAASVGVETPPIPGAEAGEQSFAETREEIERLRREDATIFEEGGTKSAAQTGEEYRQQLRKALQDPTRKRELDSFPWKAGSGLAKGDHRGHVFCATVGNRVFLRFVPTADDEEIVDELGTCLRMIECEPETERVLAEDLRRAAFGAWERARGDIYQTWMYETDPKNLQPKAPKIHREIDAFLQRHPPRGIDQERVQRVIDALAAPSSSHEQAQLREIFNDEQLDPAAKALALIEKVEELGLEPHVSPEPLPPIELEEIHLVCWMGVEVEAFRDPTPLTPAPSPREEEARATPTVPAARRVLPLLAVLVSLLTLPQPATPFPIDDNCWPNAVTLGLNANNSFQLVREARVGWVRITIPWRNVNPAQGVFDFREPETAVQAARGQGLRILAVLSTAPQWAGGGPRGNTPPANVNLWSEYVRRTAERFAGRIEAYEIWNEPDLMGSQIVGVGWDRPLSESPTYADYLEVAARAIQAEAPGTLVVGPVSSSRPEERAEELYRQLEASGVSSLIDVVSFHANGTQRIFSQVTADVERSLRLIRELNPSNAGKPTWITEFGWFGQSVGRQAIGGEDAQRDLTRRLVDRMAGAYGCRAPIGFAVEPDNGWSEYAFTHAFLYTLLEGDGEPAGIYRPNGVPKKVVTEYLREFSFPARQTVEPWFVPIQSRCSGLRCTFTGGSGNPGGGLVLRWEFGDGGRDRTTAGTVTHVYPRPGRYFVRLGIEEEGSGLSLGGEVELVIVGGVARQGAADDGLPEERELRSRAP